VRGRGGMVLTGESCWIVMGGREFELRLREELWLWLWSRLAQEMRKVGGEWVERVGVGVRLGL
jgi:hypothetical protein